MVRLIGVEEIVLGSTGHGGRDAARSDRRVFEARLLNRNHA